MFPLLSICGFVGCIMPAMASSEQGSERLNAQLLVDSIPALIHTEVGGSSPPRPTIQITSKYVAILTSPLSGNIS